MPATLIAPPVRRWEFPPAADRDAVSRLAGSLSLPDTLCSLLVGRGFGDEGAARGYLRPTVDHLHDPALLAGMGDAVARLSSAIDASERILVHGDYDVDGICTTVILVRTLRMLGAEAIPFVPHRLRHGYDLTNAGVAEAERVGAGVILTGDCGIVAHEAVEEARRAGIDVVVTDHHTPAASLPAAAAVVNPNRADCSYPFKGLCGAAVAFKLALALGAERGVPAERLYAFLDLVAVATVADLVPLADENRMLVRWGLRVLRETPNVGMRALLARAGLDGKVGAGQVGFVLAPRINAIGRLGDPMTAVRLLLTEDPGEAKELADALESENRRRREVDRETFRQAMEVLERDFDPERDRGVVLGDARWHPGVIGIVASRVAERVHRPTVLVALEGEEARGSARSVPGFDLYAAIAACAGHLTRFGGHRAAAGCSLRADRLDAFRRDFDAHARSAMREEHLSPRLRIDLALPLPAATHQLARLLGHAAPFGMGNPTPVLAARRVRALSPRIVGTDHLRMDLSGDGCTLEAIGFGMGHHLGSPLLEGPMDAAFRLEERSWRGRTSLQAKLVDLRAAA